MKEYFNNFYGVKEYLENTIKHARENGYAETLFGRVRYLPDINSGMPQVRKAAERMAVNAPIQGTAADIMKLAMIKVAKELSKQFKPNEAKMVLQVHDELVFEVKEEFVNKVAKVVRDAMEGVYQLRVPIKVDLEVGDNWGETKEI